MSSPVAVRPGRADDADALTRIFLRSRATAMPWLPTAHSEAETRWWIEHVVLGEHDVWIVPDDTVAVGFAATRAGWLGHLYLAPVAQHRGLGRRLLAVATQRNPRGLHLHVFQRNAGARRFSERAGFEHIADGDGSKHEEGEPDSVYRWSPAGVSD